MGRRGGIPASAVIDCGDCGKTVVRNGTTQRYCAQCSAVRAKARKEAWAEKAGRRVQTEAQKQVARERAAARHALGAERSTASRAAAGWSGAADPLADAESVNSIVVQVPFDYAASKNAVWSFGAPGGHVYAREKGKAYRTALTQLIRGGMEAERPWFDDKVWLDIFVEKSDHRGDAINVQDLVADAVKDAIEIDDRWFCIRRIDWSIVKLRPRLIVGIHQAAVCHMRVCSHCGLPLPLDAEHFHRNRSAPRGFGRSCKECARAVDAQRRAAKVAAKGAS